MLENCQYLLGKKGLVVGIANDESIAYGCAVRFKALGAAQAVTYQTEKAKPFVEPLARELGAEIFLPLDAQKPEQMDAVFWPSATGGDGSTSSFTPLHTCRRMTCRAASWTARSRDFSWPWTSPAIRSSGWRGSPSR